MFTQCSKCETVFRLSADALRAGGGQVRCGRCGEVFNALSRLAEDASGFTTGESPLFLETRADEILESSSSELTDAPLDHSDRPIDLADGPRDVESDELGLPPGVEIARLHFIDPMNDELAAETSLEFTLPPRELDRIFVETRTRPLQQLSADGQRIERADVIPPHPEALARAPSTDASAALVPSALGAPAIAPPAAAPPGTAPAIAAPRFAPPAPGRIAGLEVSEDVRQEMLSSLRADAGRGPSQSRPQAQSRQPPSRARLPFAVWLTAAIVLGVLLVIQVVRGNGDWMAVHVPMLGGLGSPAANLSVYQLRQWGVTGDPGAKGALRVRASIMNTAAQLQPYPLLRVSLVNRFGARVGAREFEPAEYLGHGITRMLTPGERVDATLDILDPGKDAEGFEIDVCLRGAGKTVVCAGDRTAGEPAAAAPAP